MDVEQPALDRVLLRFVLAMQPLDHLVRWLLPLVVGMVSVAHQELTAGGGMRPDPPTARLMAVVLLDELIHGRPDRPDDAELREIGTESRPEPVVGTRLVHGAGVDR